MLVSCRLGVLDGVEGVDAGGQTHARACGAGCERRGVLLLEVRYASLQLAVRLLVGMRFAPRLGELCACGRVDGHASGRTRVRTCLGASAGAVRACVVRAGAQFGAGAV